MKIALFHPWLKSKGGAERVILEFLKNTKHDVEVYTWIYDRENTFDEFKKFKINVIAPKFAKKLARYYILRGLFFLIALFSKIPLEKYDAFLISTGGLAEFVTFRN
ncbi:MAG: glycosyltransferase, partial [Candidatus Pacearchaeota archaeon]